MYSARNASGQSMMAQKSVIALLGQWPLSKWSLHCGNGKNIDSLNVYCIGLFQKWLAVTLEPMTGDTLLHCFKSPTFKCYIRNVLVFSLQTDTCLKTTQTLASILEEKHSTVNVLSPIFLANFKFLFKINLNLVFEQQKLLALPMQTKSSAVNMQFLNQQEFQQIWGNSCFPH